MATPGELVQCVARQLALTPESVTQIDRLLAESGLRKTGGRGKSAAKMDEADAAALLIAASVPGPLKSVVERTRAFWNLPIKEFEVGEHGQRMPFPTLASLPDEHTFGEALTALLTSATKKEIETHLVGMAEKRADKRIPNISHLEVSFFMPGKSAAIRFFDNSVSVRQLYNPFPSDNEGLAEWAKQIEADPSHGDLNTVCRFTSRTVFAVADLIAGGTSA